MTRSLATRSGIILAQVDMDNKVNESKEIPSLLEKLDIEGSVITPDALNCQKPIAEKIRERHIKGTAKKLPFTSRALKPWQAKHLYDSRQQGAMENQLHWILDVIFNEDRSCFYAKNAAQNMAIIRKWIITMIKRYKIATGKETAIKTMRKVSAWSSGPAAKALNYMTTN